MTDFVERHPDFTISVVLSLGSAVLSVAGWGLMMFARTAKESLADLSHVKKVVYGRLKTCEAGMSVLHSNLEQDDEVHILCEDP